jgi:streptogramin lyase
MRSTRHHHFMLLVFLVVAVSSCAGEPGETGATPDGGDESESAQSVDLASLRPVGLPDPYERQRDWGMLPEGREWGRVSGIYPDPAGATIWVFERCGGDNCVTSDDPAVLRFSPDGTLLGSFGADMFVRPHGMYVDDQGNVWVTDGRGARDAELEAAPDAAEKGNQVVKFSPEGEVLMVLGTPGVAGDPPVALNQPNDVIVAPSGEILVAEGHSYNGPHGRISRFSPDGAFLGTIGEYGDGPGQFIVPHGMAFDSQGRLFVATRGTNRIDIFGPDWEYVDSWDQFGRPNDVFIDDDDTMYVLDSESGDERNPGFRRGLYIGNARDGSVTAFVPPHEERPPLGTIGEGVAVDADGNVYVGEVSVDGVTKFTPRR